MIWYWSPAETGEQVGLVGRANRRAPSSFAVTTTPL